MSIEKDLKYYRNLDYDIKIEKESYEGEHGYIAYCDELGHGSCYGTGATPQEALENFIKDKNEFIKILYDEKKPIPEPRPREEPDSILSGIFNVRTSPQIHGLLSQQAKERGISLNLYVNQILATGSALHEAKKYFDEICNRIEDKIDAHHYQMTSQIIDYQKHTIEQHRQSQLVVLEGAFQKQKYNMAV